MSKKKFTWKDAHKCKTISKAVKGFHSVGKTNQAAAIMFTQEHPLMVAISLSQAKDVDMHAKRTMTEVAELLHKQQKNK